MSTHIDVNRPGRPPSPQATRSASLDEVRAALEESVKLQSHYAHLLNMYDGGQRRGFASADAWIARIRAVKAMQNTQAEP